MDIEYHYYMTFIIALRAGFSKDEAYKIAEVERMNKLFVGRELRMVELKERIKELEKQIGSSSK